MLFKYTIKTHKREELIDITSLVTSSVEKSGIKEGIVIVYIPHTTAGILINENADPSVCEDILNFLNIKVPKNFGFKHLEGNSDAHIKSCLIGSSKTLIISNGKLILGTWQGIFFAEFDGPRKRTIFVKVVKF